MNIGYEEDDLKPYIEHVHEYNDPTRIGNRSCVRRVACRVVVCVTGVLHA